MKIGLQVFNFNWTDHHHLAGKLAEIARTADNEGFYSLWVMDHFFQIQGVGATEEEMLEAYSTLSYLAGITKTIKLGALVTGVVYRHPGVLAKTVTTLDVLSGGRAYLGIGAAWFEREALGLGIPYPPTKERFERLEETLQIVKQMWSGEVKPYHGKHYQLAETLCSPLPLSQPHPPIMIGGMGEQKTLRLVAQYGDACNFFTFAGIEVIQARLQTLQHHCDELGRDYASIEKTCLGGISRSGTEISAAEMIAQCEELAQVGIQHAIFNLPNPTDLNILDLIGREVIPVVAAF